MARGVLVWDVMGFNPREVARAGRKVYEPHRAELERRHRGRYVLIDVKTKKLFLAASPEAAYQQAAAESGPFHLVRVGDRAAFRSRRLPNGDDTRAWVRAGAGCL